MKYEYKSDCVGLGQIIQKVKKVTKTKIKEKIDKLKAYKEKDYEDVKHYATLEDKSHLEGYVEALNDILLIIEDDD